MNKQTYIFAGFFLMVMAQLFVPANMIFQKEQTLKTGNLYKFKTAPVDPNDPFRGKYIALDFEATELKSDAEPWTNSYGKDVYVELGTDEEGFAKVVNLHATLPDNDKDYVKASIRSISNQEGIDDDYVRIRYPFDRFYMEEFKAYDAEVLYRESQGKQEAYALVRVKEGDAVIDDVIIGEMSIKEAVEEMQEEVEK